MYASLHQSDALLTENLDYRPRQRQHIAEGITVTRDIRLQKDTSLPTRIEEVSQGSSALAELPAREQERRVSSSAATEVQVKVEAMEVSQDVVEQDSSRGAKSAEKASEEVLADQNSVKVEQVQVKTEAESEPIIISDEEVEETTPPVILPLVVTAHLAPADSSADDWRTVRTAEDNLRERTNWSRNRHQEAGPKHTIRIRSRSDLRTREEELDLGQSLVFTNSALLEQEVCLVDRKDINRVKTGSRQKYCTLPQCTDAPFRNARRHAMERHFPAHFRSQQLEDMDLHQRRLGDVEYLKNELLGHRAALSALVNWVNHQQMIPEDAYVPETEGGWLSATYRMAHWQIPSSFSLHPVNSQALLFHWRVLIVVLTLVSSETRQEFRDGGWNEPSEELPADLTIVDSVGFGEETVPDIQRPVQQDTGSLRLVAWDSHFHLDRTSQKLFGHHRASVQDVITAEVGVQPKQPVNVVWKCHGLL